MSETAPDGDESGTAAPKRKGKGKRKHTVLKVVAISVVLLGLVTGLGGHLRLPPPQREHHHRGLHRGVRRAAAGEAEASGPQEPLNILVMGSDTRAGEGNNIDNLTGLGQRSDTTILIHLSADRKRAYGISIPRDSLVTRPDCKDADGEIVPGGTDVMWNEAFNLAGPGCTISQFEQTTGVPVDHHVVLDFQGFQDMVDAVNGVQVCIPETVDDRAHGIYLEAGTREISGKEALSYVRQRYAVGDGSDIGRLKRQQAFMSAMANKVVSAGTLANPVTLVRVPRRGDQVADRRLGSREPVQARQAGLPVQGHRAVQDPVLHDPVGVHRGPQPGRVGRARRPGRLGPDQERRAAHRHGRPATPSRPGTCPARPRARPRCRERVGRPDEVADGDRRTATPPPRRRPPPGSAHDRVPGAPATAPPTRPSGSASAGSPRSSGTCSPTPRPTSASPARAAPDTASDEWLRAQVPPHHG